MTPEFPLEAGAQAHIKQWAGRQRLRHPLQANVVQQVVVHNSCFVCEQHAARRCLSQADPVVNDGRVDVFRHFPKAGSAIA